MNVKESPNQHNLEIVYLFLWKNILLVNHGVALMMFMAICHTCWLRYAFAAISFIAETFIFLYVGMDALDTDKWKSSNASLLLLLLILLGLHITGLVTHLLVEV
ncbi:uncharacterized protein LOC115980001 [Quercus lobata]|uniref:uncharacterized protein LOC115980001 n=1 Tax=Quercus lobata TaxID=97700 RepID=UPI0012470E72|nr:uncharacterized protein LOC115980001 [Quercus lobata]